MAVRIALEDSSYQAELNVELRGEIQVRCSACGGEMDTELEDCDGQTAILIAQPCSCGAGADEGEARTTLRRVAQRPFMG